jgi:hypothetical protein
MAGVSILPFQFGSSARSLLGAAPGSVFGGGTTVFGPIGTFGGPQTYFGPLAGNTAPVNNVPNTFDPTQFSILKTVHDTYSNNLATKQYEKIPHSITQYLSLINSLKNFKITDEKLLLMIQIASSVVTGSLNANTLYSSYAYNEIAIITLTKRIQEILSGINVIETSKGVGQFTATQLVKLTPIYNYYIHLYGFPEPGVGFDPAKLAFLKTIPAVQERIAAYDAKRANLPATATSTPAVPEKKVDVSFAKNRLPKTSTGEASQFSSMSFASKDIKVAPGTRTSTKFDEVFKRRQKQKAMQTLELTKSKQ